MADATQVRQLRIGVEARAALIAPPTVTPWNSLNARLSAPADLQLTVFAELGDEQVADS